MQQCQTAVWTQSVFQSISFQTLLVRRVSVHDVLTPQQFQDSITTAATTTQAVSAQKSHKERQVQGKGVKTSAFKSI